MVLNRNSIRTKVFLSFMLLTVTMCTAMVVCLFLHRNLQKMDQKLETIISDQSILDNIIKKELMFLHSEPQNFYFHESGQDLRLNEINKSYDSLFSRIAANKQTYAKLLGEYYRQLQDQQPIKKHQQLFKELLIKIKARGSKDYGTVGEMRNAIHVLEADAKFLELDEILSLRRSEKDFLLRHDAEYSALLNEKVRKLLKKYTGKKGFVETDLVWLNVYQQKFNEVVSLVDEIGDFGHSGLKMDLEKSIKAINFMVDTIRNRYESYRSTVSTRISIGFIVTLALAIATGILFSLYVSDYRTKPLKFITRKFQQNIDNRLRLQKINIDKIPNLSIEHIQLVTSFNRLLDQLNLQMQKVKRSNSDLKEKNDELVKVNRELDQFVYSVSHDIRAPITSIKGLINVLNMEKDDKAKGIYMGMIEDRIEKLDGFIKDMLDLSRNSRLNIARNKIDLYDLIDEVILEHQFFGNSPSITKEIEINQNFDFYSDRKRIKVIFSNLISNAIRFCDRRKEESKIAIKSVTDDQQTIIEFWDNGVGIHGDFRDQVFDMFFQASDNVEGSGLGLYIVMETVRKLNGELLLSSEYGHWTKFTLRLPNLNYSDKPLEVAN